MTFVRQVSRKTTKAILPVVGESLMLKGTNILMIVCVLFDGIRVKVDYILLTLVAVIISSDADDEDTGLIDV